MGHYSECYERDDREREARKAKGLQLLKERFPDEYLLALEYKRAREAYDLFSNHL